MFNGRFADADGEYRLARELDPLDLKIRAHHALNLLYAGEDGRAIAELDAVLELEPTHVIARVLRGAARLWRGDAGGAAADYGVVLQAHPGLTIGEIGLAGADAISGHRRAARNRLLRLQHAAESRYLPPYQVR